MKFKIEIRKTIAIISIVALVITLFWSLHAREKEIILIILGTLTGVINFYFAKSTALDVPGQMKKDGE